MPVVVIGKPGTSRWAAAALAAVLLVAGIALVLVIREWTARRELARLRATLERSIESGAPPGLVRADWRALVERLTLAGDADPAELALLARRASAHVSVELAEFGLLAEPPRLRLDWRGGFDAGVVDRYRVEVEGSWDAGPWRPVAVCDVTRRLGVRRLGGAGQFRLERLVPRESLTAGEHRLELRGRYAFHDPAEPNGTDDASIGGCQAPGLEGGTVPPPAGEVAWEETRSMGSHPVRLFEHYPEGFPTGVPLSSVAEPLDAWFHVDRVLIVRVRVPDGAGARVSFAWPGAEAAGEPVTGCLPERLGPERELLGGFALRGRMTARPPVPLVVEGRLILEDGSQPLVEFDLRLGEGAIELIALARQGVHFEPSAGPAGRVIRGLASLYPAGPKLDPAAVAADLPQDGARSGLLRLEPAHGLVLASRDTIDRYVDTTIALAVEVDVVTVEGVLLAEGDSRLAEPCGPPPPRESPQASDPGEAQQPGDG